MSKMKYRHAFTEAAKANPEKVVDALERSVEQSTLDEVERLAITPDENLPIDETVEVMPESDTPVDETHSEAEETAADDGDGDGEPDDGDGEEAAPVVEHVPAPAKPKAKAKAKAKARP